jgi:iron-sulfur cluster assembly accessory protein
MAGRIIFVAIAVVAGSSCLVNGFGMGRVERAWMQRTTTRYMSESATTPPTDVGTAEGPEDPVICIKDSALERLRELKSKQKDPNEVMVLRMGVRNGGCSGLSYVMDFSTEAEIQEDDMVDEYTIDNIKCVVDAKSMLYLYGLELDYSDELIGGGFKFFNPNAEESCGCGSSFGV